MRRIFVLTGLILFLSGLPTAWAHHGWSEFDQDKRLELEGTILESSFEYPHVSMKLLVDDTPWNVIMAPPARVRRIGLDEKILSEGTEISIAGHPHKNTDHTTRIFELTVHGESYTVR
jgi:hypothetical protein